MEVSFFQENDMTNRDRLLCLVGSALGVVLVGLLPAKARATPAIPPGPAPPAFSLFHDLRLTIHARRALSESRELAPLNLGVKVKGGVATLWGPVPSDEAARRALKIVGAVEGIIRVESDLHIERPRPSVAWLPRSTTTRVSTASPDRSSWSLDLLNGAAREAPPPPLSLPQPAAQAESPPRALRDRLLASAHKKQDRGTRAAPPPAPLVLPDKEIPPPAILPAGSTRALVQAVRRLQRDNAGFEAVQFEVRGATVVVRPGEAAQEYAMAFAEKVRKLPGVTEVRFED
jgi:hypothetical protein